MTESSAPEASHGSTRNPLAGLLAFQIGKDLKGSSGPALYLGTRQIECSLATIPKPRCTQTNTSHYPSSTWMETRKQTKCKNKSDNSFQKKVVIKGVEMGGKAPEPMACGLSEIVSGAGDRESNDHELGRRSHG